MPINRGKEVFRFVFIFLALLFSVPRVLLAEREPEVQAGLIQDRQEAGKAQTEEASRLIELLKQRALLKTKAVERPKPKVWKIDLAMINGFENNVNQDSFRKGDYSNEQDFTFTVSPKVTNSISYTLSCFVRDTWYSEQRDNSTYNSGFTSSVRWQPTKQIRWDVIGYEYELNDYIQNMASSFKDNRILTKIRHTINKNLYHQLSFTESLRYYTKRKARDGSKNPLREELREDDRSTVSYEIGGGLWGLQLKLKQDFYKHTSNDAYQDYYDALDYKVKPSVSKQWNDQWTTSLSTSFERKNYEERVSTDRGYAQYDDIYEYALNVYYILNKTVTLAYTAKYKWLDSNDPGSEYSNQTHQIATYIAF